MTYDLPIPVPDPTASSSAGEITSAVLNRRIFARIKPYWLHCDRGYLLDISMNGVKVLSRRTLADQHELRIWDDRDGLSLQAQVVWSRRIGFRQHEVGFHFMPLSQTELPQLINMATRFHD